jgi:hypothetical protein
LSRRLAKIFSHCRPDTTMGADFPGSLTWAFHVSTAAQDRAQLAGAIGFTHRTVVHIHQGPTPAMAPLLAASLAVTGRDKPSAHRESGIVVPRLIRGIKLILRPRGTCRD